MVPRPGRFVALLRGINVGGANKVPMAGLRDMCAELGWTDVATYIQSGNAVFTAAGPAEQLEMALESAINDRLGLEIPVMVRSLEQWRGYLSGNPFPTASETEAKWVALAVPKAAPSADAVARLEERAAGGERIERVGDVLWFHYPEGLGRSKLTPALVDRAVGSPVTARNWRTVQKIADLLSPTPKP